MTTQHRPRDVNELKVLIAKRAVVLSEQQERVTRAALSNPELVAFGTSSSVATASSVSPSTVGRVTHAFGFGSFRDFRDIFRRHLQSELAAGPK
jgi:DNA-binding MurR/RpiR family transcriptional regulator